MERLINIHIEKLPENVYLATSKDVQGLIAQGRTVSETLEIARDVIRKLLESKKERQKKVLICFPSSFFWGGGGGKGEQGVVIQELHNEESEIIINKH